MELKELREKLNKKHVKVRVPKIYGESYAVQYARLLKNFTDNIVENFSGLVEAIFELTEENVKKAVLDSSARSAHTQNDRIGSGRAVACESAGGVSPTKRGLKNSRTNFLIKDKQDSSLPALQAFRMTRERVMDEGSFDEWDEFFKEHEQDITNIERELYGRKKRKSKDEPERAWKELLGIITTEIAAKYPKKTKEIVDYTSSLSSLFDYYTGRAELLARDWTDKELNNLYRYVYGSYKSKFPNLSISGEYYEKIMQAVVSENLALIKSIPQEVLKDMQVALSQGIISGNQKELIKSLKRIKGVNKDRAVFIARDQIHKAVESFKQVQNTALGIEYYEWLTADDERVSSGIGGHAQNNHRIFKYGSNEAIISHSAKRGFYYGKPGDRPNCRCIAVGVILDTDEKIVKNPDGYGYKIIKKGD